MSDPRARIQALIDAIYGQPAGAAITPACWLCSTPSWPATPGPATPARRTAHRERRDPDHLWRPGARGGSPPLQTLHETLDTTFASIVSGVHILPFFPSTSDDGFSVVDYRAVDPALGTWADIERLGQRYRLMFDAVVNHISASSAWFRDVLAGVPGAEARFHILDPATDLRG